MRRYRCGDCGCEVTVTQEPGEYDWPDCSCLPDDYQLIGWQEVPAP